jgi:O-antigen/teichoic acid export membrane protein
VFGFIYVWIDTIMLTVMTRSQVVGWYGATTTLFQTLMFLPVLVSTAWLPRLVTAFGRGHRNLIEAARRPIEFILVISVPVAAGTALAAHFLVHAVYGPSFARAVPVMVILACCIPLTYLNIMLAQVLLAAKRQAVWTTVMAGAAVVNPLLNLLLIPATQRGYHNGAIGASISLLVTELLMDIIGFVLVGRHVFDRGGIRRCALAIAASAGMWGVAYAARPIGPLLSLLAGFATLLLLAVALRILTPDEIAQVRAGVTRLRGGRVTESA